MEANPVSGGLMLNLFSCICSGSSPLRPAKKIAAVVENYSRTLVQPMKTVRFPHAAKIAVSGPAGLDAIYRTVVTLMSRGEGE